MAQAPVLYDFDIALSQVDRGLEQRVSVRTARHPSETLDRVWLRVPPPLTAGVPFCATPRRRSSCR